MGITNRPGRLASYRRAMVLCMLAGCSSGGGAGSLDTGVPADALDGPAAMDVAQPMDSARPDDTGQPDDRVVPADGVRVEHPNFIFVLAEANGWTSTSVQEDPSNAASRSTTAQTPSLERIAAEGMRFTDFYAPSPRCMPSRASYFTGVSPAALHMTFVPESRSDGAATGNVICPTPLTTHPTSTPTVASLLRPLGYTSAHFGKWHAGMSDPSLYGFDASDGPTANRGPDNVDHPNPTQAYGMTDRAIAWMSTQVAAHRPFYLQVSTYGGKDPVDSMPDTYAATAARLAGQSANTIAVAATQADMDVNITRILQRVDELGIAGTTYVLFSGDHGAQGTMTNLPLTRGKGTVWEGGIRVPLFIRGPGIPAGAVSHVRAVGEDLVPTFLALAGLTTWPSAVEGGSLVDVLLGAGTTVRRPREAFVVHFPHYDFDPLGPASTLILGDYKVIRFYEDSSLRLFDLATDLEEAHDLSSTDSTRATSLNQMLSDYLAAVNAQMPTHR